MNEKLFEVEVTLKMNVLVPAQSAGQAERIADNETEYITEVAWNEGYEYSKTAIVKKMYNKW